MRFFFLRHTHVHTHAHTYARTHTSPWQHNTNFLQKENVHCGVVWPWWDLDQSMLKSLFTLRSSAKHNTGTLGFHHTISMRFSVNKVKLQIICSQGLWCEGLCVCVYNVHVSVCVFIVCVHAREHVQLCGADSLLSHWHFNKWYWSTWTFIGKKASTISPTFSKNELKVDHDLEYKSETLTLRRRRGWNLWT